MNDEELLRRVAEIEGEAQWEDDKGNFVFGWNPLTNDAQAMALVKKYSMNIAYSSRDSVWQVSVHHSMDTVEAGVLNKAILKAIVATKGG